MKKRNARLLGLACAALTATAYSAITGKGIFNKYRFKNEHQAIANYVESNYPGSQYSPVQKTEQGYAVIILRPDLSRVMLYVMPTETGDYVFKEVMP